MPRKRTFPPTEPTVPEEPRDAVTSDATEPLPDTSTEASAPTTPQESVAEIADVAASSTDEQPPDAAVATAPGADPRTGDDTTVAEDLEPAPLPFPGPARTAPRSVSEIHLKGIIESLVFVSDKPLTAADVGRLARAEARDVRRLLGELRDEYRGRGVQLDEIAGGWQFRSSAANAPFVRELLQAKPVRLTRAQVETLAIVAYRQPITRPEVDDIRGVDTGSALKVLLDRDLVRILGRKEEVGRPVLYGTTHNFLEFFGLKSLRDLPTLREFTDLSPESEATLVREMGDDAAPAERTTAPPSAVTSGVGSADPSADEPVGPGEPAEEPVAIDDE